MPLGNSHGFWMTLLAAYLYLGSALECSRMVQHRYASFDQMPGIVGCIGIMLATMIPLLAAALRWDYPANCPLGMFGLTITAALIALIGCFVWMMPGYVPGSGALERIVLSGWIAVYFGIGFAFWVAMRQIGSDRWALATVVGMIVVTKFTDAGAYFTGRALGKTKLCPSISPGKTLEGLMGGMIVGVLVSWIYFVPFMSWLFAQAGSSAESSASAATVNPSGMGAILLGILLTLAGLIGDLLESMVKRETECKDSSRVLPGLGGLWDVTDSLIPAGVVGYLILASGLLHHTSH